MLEIKRTIFKHKEIISYIIYGVLTTVINYISYIFLTRLFNVSEMSSVVSAWIVSVIFAFFTNKFFVFNSKNKNLLMLNEFIVFTGSRISTLLLEILLMFLLVKVLLFNDLICKAIINVIIIVLNYIFSKLFVFKKV